MRCMHQLMSDRVTDKEQFVDAILAIYGTLLSDGDEYDEEGNKISDSADEAQEELKKKKILELPDGTKAEYLTRTFDENGVEILKKAIEQDIQSFHISLVCRMRVLVVMFPGWLWNLSCWGWKI